MFSEISGYSVNLSAFSSEYSQIVNSSLNIHEYSVEANDT